MEEVREDDLNKALSELQERRFQEDLENHPEIIDFIERFVQSFGDNSIYFRKSLIIDATKYMVDARENLREYSGLSFATKIENVFDKYNDLMLFIKSERERTVRSIKELIKLLIKEKEETLEDEANDGKPEQPPVER